MTLVFDIADATRRDFADIQSIYAHHVLHGTGTFEETPPSLEEMLKRHDQILSAGYAWLVARDVLGVLGYGYYNAFRARAAYRFTVEDSIYIRDSVVGQGVGGALMAALLARAAAGGFKQMLAVIGDSGNHGSIALHAKAGFEPAGVMRAVGYKFGRWLDVVTMQKAL